MFALSDVACITPGRFVLGLSASRTSNCCIIKLTVRVFGGIIMTTARNSF